MKKIFSLLLTLNILYHTVLPLPSTAAPGDIIAQALHTDIVAYINHYAIPSYIVNGRSFVIAEDLKNFGFDVVFNNDTRTLTITKNPQIHHVREMTVNKSAATGEIYSNLVESDIKVYANHKQLTSYSLNGYMMVPLEEFTVFGAVNWIPEERAIKLWVNDLVSRSTKQIPTGTNVKTTYQKEELKTSDISVNLIIPNKNGENSYVYWEFHNRSNSDIIISDKFMMVGEKLWYDGLRPIKIPSGLSKKDSVTLYERLTKMNATCYLAENCTASLEIEWKGKKYIVYFNSNGVTRLTPVYVNQSTPPMEFKLLDKDSLNDLSNEIRNIQAHSNK